MTTPRDYEVEEVMSEDGDLLVLSLGFRSDDDPLDVLHIACGPRPSGRNPKPDEDELYLERTDQDLACSGIEIVSLVQRGMCVELTLTSAGATALGLGTVTRFRFHDHPALLAGVRPVLEKMARLGHAQIAEP